MTRPALIITLQLVDSSFEHKIYVVYIHFRVKRRRSDDAESDLPPAKIPHILHMDAYMSSSDDSVSDEEDDDEDILPLSVLVSYKSSFSDRKR